MKKRYENILIGTTKKNGILSVLCTVILILTAGSLAGCSVQETVSDESVYSAGIVSTDNGALRVREEPDRDSNIISLLPNGEEITILSEEDDFYKISLQDEDGTVVGYVMKKYVVVEYGKEEGNFARTADDPSQMPDIVFFNIIDYKESAPDGEYESAMTFYDKNGNHYVTDAAYGSYICGLKYEELISEYAAGNLDNKITLHTSCDVNELFENYRKLCELSKNDDYEILYPEAVPAVEANEEFWYGFCYDESGELRALKIHEKGAGGHYDTNDERANEIYEWYIGTFRAPSETMAYITNFDSEKNIYVDEIEWVVIPGSRAEELGLQEEDGPSGFYIYNPNSVRQRFTLSEDSKITVLDWQNSYEPLEVSAEDFIAVLQERGEQNNLIPFSLKTANGEITEISEHYVP